MSDYDALVPQEPGSGSYDDLVPKKKKDFGFMDYAGAAIEPLLALGSSAAVAIPAGLAGLGQAINNPLGIGEPRAPGDVVRSIQDRYTYQPRTEGGKTAMEAISYPFEKFNEAAEFAGRKVQDVTGSPGLAAQAETGIKMVPQAFGMKAASRVEAPLLPKRATGVTELTGRDVRLTPGQTLGQGWDRTEQAISKWPIIGEPVRAARSRALEDFNKAAINDSLAPIDRSLPKDMPAGQKAVAHAYDILGTAYDDLLAKMKGNLDSPGPQQNALPSQVGQQPTPSLRAELDNIKSMAQSSKMPPALVEEIGRIIDTEIVNRFQKGGVASGETLKEIQSQLRDLAQTKGRSENYDIRQQGAALTEARAALDRMIERENPQYAAELKAVNEGYAKFKIVQRAAAAPGAKEGIFTPAGFKSAVRAKDTTKDKRASSEGEANQQPLAQAAEKVLGNTIPDSGTPSQLLLAHALLGGGAGHMLFGPAGITAGLTLPALYSRPGVAAMSSLLTNPPSGARGAVRAGSVGGPQEEMRRRFIAEMLNQGQ